MVVVAVEDQAVAVVVVTVAGDAVAIKAAAIVAPVVVAAVMAVIEKALAQMVAQAKVVVDMLVVAHAVVQGPEALTTKAQAPAESTINLINTPNQNPKVSQNQVAPLALHAKKPRNNSYQEQGIFQQMPVPSFLPYITFRTLPQ